jgi:hypothetical protein
MQTDKIGGWNVGSGTSSMGFLIGWGREGIGGRSRNIHTSASGPRFLIEKDDGPDLVGITNFFDRCSEVTLDGEVHQIIVFK